MAEPSVAPSALPERSPRFVELVVRVAAAFAISPRDVLDGRKFKSRVAARHVVMWLMRKTWSPMPSFPEIGIPFGYDHTTIMHAVKRIDAQVAAGTEVGQIALRLAEPPVLRLVSNEPVEPPVAAAE